MLRFTKNLHQTCAQLKNQFKVAKPSTAIIKIEDVIKEGSEIEGFLVNRIYAVPEIDTTAVYLRHVRTGSDYLHLCRDDDNNVFSIGFRTTPRDSSGVAHVLKRVVLCGSMKYPNDHVLEKMSTRSMANFMNALMGPDYTLYPFATQNRQDFANLLSVYLDAVFRPLLKENHFLQEGWRFEPEDPTNRDSNLVVKGNVYSEMLRLSSDDDSIFSTALLNNLLPSNTYGVVTGGDPISIPDLSLDDLRGFYGKFYHPSNCHFYSYGNFPLTETLSYINDRYLSEFPDSNDLSKFTKVPEETRWDAEKRVHVLCSGNRVRNASYKSSIAFATLCNDVRNQQETFVMKLLSEILLNTSFVKDFLQKFPGAKFTPTTGYNAQTRDTFFSVGLCGVSALAFDEVVEKYFDVVNNVVERGVDSIEVEKALHKMEFNRKHQSGNFGLEMLFSLTPVWNHSGDVTEAIQIDDNINRIKQLIASDKSYLQSKVKQYLQDELHRLILSMSPREDFQAKRAEQIEQSTARRVRKLSPEMLHDIHEKTAELQRLADRTCEIPNLPELSVKNLPETVEKVELKGFSVQKVPVQVCNVQSNGVTYVRGVLNSAILSEEARNLLPLFCVAACQMSTRRRDFKQLERSIQLKTGLFSMSTHVAENIYDVNSFEEGLVFSSMCLDRNVSSMMSLWTEIFTEIEFEDFRRIKHLTDSSARDVMNEIQEVGDLYAVSVAAAKISPSAERRERLGGLTYLKSLQRILFQNNLSGIVEIMNSISRTVLNKRIIRISINTSEANEENTLTSIDKFLSSIPSEFRKSFEITSPKPQINASNSSTHFVTPSSDNFTAHCIKTVAYTDDNFPLLRLAASLLTNAYLIPNIKEQGAAHATRANMSTSGTWSMSTFKDHNPNRTFDVFNNAISWLESGAHYTENDVEIAKIKVLQSLDFPVPPGSKGIRNFLYGISDDEVQRHRMMILKATKSDVMKVPGLFDTRSTSRCLIGPENNDILMRRQEHWHRTNLI